MSNLRCEPIPHDKIKIENRPNPENNIYSIWEVWVNNILVCSCYGKMAVHSAVVIAKEFEQGTIPDPGTVVRFQRNIS